MKTNAPSASFTRCVHPWEYWLLIIAILVLYGLYAWMSLWLYGTARLFSVITFGVLVLLGVLFLMRVFLERITISSNGITLSLCGFVLKHIDRENIRTVVKHNAPKGRTPLNVLLISPVSAREMEAEGERRLCKKALIRNELKFREGRSDWGDLCLGATFYRHDTLLGGYILNCPAWKSAIWIEFSPERQALLREQFPNAEFREAKRYYDPPSTK